MRKLIAALFISLDGVAEAPDQWEFDSVDEGLMGELGSQLAEQDTVLLGRGTYDEWASYWPTSTDEPFASYINSTQKYVFSKTLERADWQNTTLLKGDLSEEINRLKALPGKNMGTAGGPGLVRALVDRGLVDELTLAVFPVIAGKGKRLFGEDSPLQRMSFIRATPTPSGIVFLSYRPR